MAAPNLPALDTNWLLETYANGTVIGRISVSDPDGDALAVSIVDAFGDTDLTSAFELVYEPATGQYKLVVKDATKINFETVGPTLNLRIKVADATQAVIKDFALTVVDVNEAPTNIVISSRSVDEHAAAGTWIADIGGSDQDAGDVLSYSLKDAATSPFEIVRNAAGVYQLRVKDGSLIDYASDPDKMIDVTIVATDRYGLKIEKTFALDIREVNHAPTDILIDNADVRELSYDGLVIGQLSTLDEDAGDSFTYSLIDDAGGRFYVDGNELRVKNGYKLDSEQASSHEIRVLVTDGSGASFEKTISIYVMDWLDEYTGGSDANDYFRGGLGADRLSGGKGDDTLVGSYGQDVLTGGEGKDVFVFDTRAYTANRDIVVDFTVGEDKIHLTGSLFKLEALTGGGLTEATFHLGPVATSTSQRILYDIETGRLFYDGDGSRELSAPVLIATFLNKQALTMNDFLVIA
ncbi:hypothetical protein MHY87_18380 [Microvirga sp. ACRRW]|uniref:M10 family metallopeptidase C-terminal domain-containing protein n=1 Tax=Microvirga sp. ACRRW TaxID=2918205 RepID=UPI001EF6E34B|nr:M10 family metallopeptidase C-terminal domain-containing protein [Microvirga sp. ACRRW]MCG7394871.1 hypothetical protein [Microvirga sp. ACRRW]